MSSHSTLKTEAIFSFETSLKFCQFTWCPLLQVDIHHFLNLYLFLLRKKYLCAMAIFEMYRRLTLHRIIRFRCLCKGGDPYTYDWLYSQEWPLMSKGLGRGQVRRKTLKHYTESDDMAPTKNAIHASISVSWKWHPSYYGGNKTYAMELTSLKTNFTKLHSSYENKNKPIYVGFNYSLAKWYTTLCRSIQTDSPE
jgi:hypothetical protein